MKMRWLFGVMALTAFGMMDVPVTAAEKPARDQVRPVGGRDAMDELFEEFLMGDDWDNAPGGDQRRMTPRDRNQGEVKRPGGQACASSGRKRDDRDGRGCPMMGRPDRDGRGCPMMGGSDRDGRGCPMMGGRDRKGPMPPRMDGRNRGDAMLVEYLEVEYPDELDAIRQQQQKLNDARQEVDGKLQALLGKAREEIKARREKMAAFTRLVQEYRRNKDAKLLEQIKTRLAEFNRDALAGMKKRIAADERCLKEFKSKYDELNRRQAEDVARELKQVTEGK